jgi:dihydrofolate synthase/folylpolyglutamate synthase
MPEPELVEYVRRLRPSIEETGATFFEATTCVAFQYFADHGVDVAVIETGLGGRLDATNVVIPLVSIITNIGLDHQEYLGDTVSRIAREKAGIIKHGAPVVTAAEGIALEMIRAVGRKRRTSVFLPREVNSLVPMGERSGHAVVDVRGGRWRLDGVLLGLGGAHQVANAALAVSALSLTVRSGIFQHVSAEAVRMGLENVSALAGLRCRLERIRSRHADLTIDVAHNPDGVKVATAPFIGRRGPSFDVVVFGAMKDKDYGAMLALLAAVGGTIVAVRPRTPRAATVRDILRMGRTLGVLVEAGGSVEAGLRLAIRRARRGSARRKSRILVIGSHYVAGEALLALEKTP